MLLLKSIKISNLDVLPIIEGGKGIGISNGVTAGNFAKAGAVGTFSAVNADYYDHNGKYIPQSYINKPTRKEKFYQLVDYSIKAALSQARIANDIASGNGRIHMNILWEAGGAKKIIEEVLSKAKGLIHGITCGAGLPYGLAEIATKYKVYYYPIVSSARAFSVLWKRAYNKLSNFLGGVVYEDPWLAGGHSGLSSKENPDILEDPYDRIVSLRKYMTEIGLKDLPIIMAGGVWALKEWSHFIDNKDIGNIAFQFGTRPLLTKESPISNDWKKLLTTLDPKDILLHKYSPTGFYSLAIKNDFLNELINREKRQIIISKDKTLTFNEPLLNKRGNVVAFIKKEDINLIKSWKEQGYTTFLKTPDNTIIFVSEELSKKIKADQVNCMGCLSHCRFSNWSDSGNHTTGILPDPRSFCIQKTLQDVIHNGNLSNNLLFAGKNAFRFKIDSFYKNGFIPTISQLVDRISIGE